MALKLSGVVQGYGAKLVVDRFDLELSPGVVGLLGPNGAGKTTLLRTMAAILPPLRGQVSIDGDVADSEHSARRARRKVGYLPQDFGFDPRMKVLDSVRYAAWLRGLPSRETGRAADEALEQLELVDHRGTRMGRLSGGMRRRVGIAWAIVGKPPVILLDEPTVGLDLRQRLQFRKTVSALRASVVVLSTHLVDDVEAVCDRIVVFYGGRTRFLGTIADMAALGRGDLPGDTDLERAYMSLLPVEEQRL